MAENEERPTAYQYEVKNIGKAPRILYSASGKAITVMPGKAVKINLVERAAADLDNYSSSVLDVRKLGEATDDSTVRRKARRKAAAPGGGDQSGDDAGDAGDSGDDAAQRQLEDGERLIQRYENDELNFGEFSHEAKELLGDRWPGGTPKKVEIYALLRGEKQS